MDDCIAGAGTRTCWPGSWIRTVGWTPGRPPNIYSLSRGRGKLGADTLRVQFDHVAGRSGKTVRRGLPPLGLRVISMGGSTADLPDSPPNVAFFGRPSTAERDGAFPQVRWVAGTGSLAGETFARTLPGSRPLVLDLLACFGLVMLVLVGRNFPVLAPGPRPLGLRWCTAMPDLTRANRLVTCFEPREDVAGGVGEVGVEGEALAVDLNGR